MDRISHWALAMSCLLFLNNAESSIVITSTLLTESTNIKPASENPDNAFTSSATDGGFVTLPDSYKTGDYLPAFSISDPALRISFTVTEATFDTYNGLPDNLSLFNTTGSNLRLEPSNVNQNDVGSSSWGFDTESPISNSSNAVLIFDFSQSENNIYQFGADLIDFEGGNGRSAYVGLYDSAQQIWYQEAFSFPDAAGANRGYGNREVRFFGIESLNSTPISSIVFAVGDDTGGSGGAERLALGDIYLSTQPNEAATPVPVPGGIWLLISGVIVIVRYLIKRS